jgi:hypothetical protein
MRRKGKNREKTPNTTNSENRAEQRSQIAYLWDGLSVRLSICLSVCLYVTPRLQHLENHMPKGNKGSRPERKLEAQEK